MFKQFCRPFFGETGTAPPFTPFLVDLEDGDVLYCKLSTPPKWTPNQCTIVLVHGLGGTDSSSYMIRMSRKFYTKGYRCLRMNLRGTGEGVHLAKRPYHGGTSHDVLKAVQSLKAQTPESSIILMGFSLGGNIILKLMGELKEKALGLVDMALTICAPLDLGQTMEFLLNPSNRFYHQYYVKSLKQYAGRWIRKDSIRTIRDFESLITAPLWDFSDVFDYYQQCSSKFFLSGIQQNCHLIFAKDDPFINYHLALQPSLSSKVKIWLSEYGGHMGFWGWAGKEHRYHWLDALLLKIIGDHGIPKRTSS